MLYADSILLCFIEEHFQLFDGCVLVYVFIYVVEPGRRLQDLSINGATVPGDLPVHSSVTVANDGSGNFTTIADAVSFAPPNIDAGYFIIQIKEGLYKEHVVIRQNKKNLMLIGQGIGKTVVTGDRSQRTGWSLMDTSTFSKHRRSIFYLFHIFEFRS